MAEAIIDNFERIADRWAEAARPAKVPSCLYHYTDADGLLGILRGGTIWATDYRFLNDRAEMEHTRTGVRELITERLSTASFNLERDLFGRIMKDLEVGNPYVLYVFSMSEDKDDLSQWRAYARDGEGFTVGLCAKTLQAIMLSGAGGFGLRKIEYDHAVQRATLEHALDEMIVELKRACERDGSRSRWYISVAAHWYNWLCHSRGSSNKHQSFRGEKEWRLISFAESDDEPAHVRSRGLGLTRYGEISPRGEGETRLPIVEIGIGPGFVGNEVVSAVKEICRETGYAPHIYFADTPYRRL